ncbi:MAG: hypothetical protein ABH810_01895 [bacterium]
MQRGNVDRTKMNNGNSLFQILSGTEKAFREGGEDKLQGFWRDQIIKDPNILRGLLEGNKLPYLAAEVRRLIAPPDEDKDHTLFATHYWDGQMALAIAFTINSNKSWHDPDMAEEERHEQFMTELVRDTAKAVAHIKID